jgi:folylpolyglutamate synthase/dihydropteroate synthase
MQKNKLPDQFIKSFKKIFKKIIAVTIPNEPNALKAEELRLISQKYMPSSTAPNIKLALKQLSSTKKKTIVIFGSLYLTGAVLSKN